MQESLRLGTTLRLHVQLHRLLCLFRLVQTHPLRQQLPSQRSQCRQTRSWLQPAVPWISMPWTRQDLRDTKPCAKCHNAIEIALFLVVSR